MVLTPILVQEDSVRNGPDPNPGSGGVLGMVLTPILVQEECWEWWKLHSDAVSDNCVQRVNV